MTVPVPAWLDAPPDEEVAAPVHTREQTELLSNLVYGHPESSGPPARFFVVHSIDEPLVGDHVRQMTEAA